MPDHRIAVLMNALDMGGAERAIVHLARGMTRRGLALDVALVKRSGPLLDDLPAEARIIELGTASRLRAWSHLFRLPESTRRLVCRRGVFAKHQALPKVIRSIPRIVDYLRKARPAALLTTLPNNNIAALWASFLAQSETRIVVREANMLSIEIAHARQRFERHLSTLAREWYPHAAGVIAVSDGVAADLAELTALPRARITTVHNPVDIERVTRLGAEPPKDTWADSEGPPLVLAVGRLAPQKDYATLLRAFARIVACRPARLVILGEGTERPALEMLAEDLGIAKSVRLPGLCANPYAYMARAKVLVLSSAWEGFPNVLIEALACGCPVVSTDCPSGPAELLENGRFGRLTPVGDDVALAEAVVQTLSAPPSPARLRERAARFSLDAALDRYLSVMLP